MADPSRYTPEYKAEPRYTPEYKAEPRYVPTEYKSEPYKQDYKPEPYPTKPVAEYYPAASRYQHDAAPGPIATAEDFQKIKCFAAFSFFAWYCPYHAQYQNYKLDVKYPTEQFWGRYQNEFDSFVAGGCDSKEGQKEFDYCLQQGAYIKTYVTKPKVFT